MSSILWRRDDGLGLERCVMEPTPDGWRIVGTVLLVSGDLPTEIRYSIQTDQAWQTVSAGAHVQTPEGDRRMAITADGTGAWYSGGQPVLDLHGAVDIDLSWTPSTITLPIRRLDLAVGESADVVAAWVGFPDHHIERVVQRYERVTATTYRCWWSNSPVELIVDEMGRVLDYPGRWQMVAAG